MKLDNIKSNKELYIICIVCPTGCNVKVHIDNNNNIVSWEGNECKKGEKYIQSEYYFPKRIITTTVKVKNGVVPLVSVKSTGGIPKNKIFDCIKKINELEIEAPIYLGDIIVHNILDLGVDIVSTNEVDKKIL